MKLRDKILYEKTNVNTRIKRYLFFTQSGYDGFVKANQNMQKDYHLSKSNINKCFYPVILIWIKLQKWYDETDDKFISFLIMIGTILILIGTIILILFAVLERK